MAYAKRLQLSSKTRYALTQTDIQTFFAYEKTALGEGSFGSVYLVRRISDNQLYALKKVRQGTRLKFDFLKSPSRSENLLKIP